MFEIIFKIQTWSKIFRKKNCGYKFFASLENSRSFEIRNRNFDKGRNYDEEKQTLEVKNRNVGNKYKTFKILAFCIEISRKRAKISI